VLRCWPPLPTASAQRAEGAKVFIVSPKDGATVDKTFTVKFGMEGLKLAPATDQTPTPLTSTC
jgi:hypothetical protein